MATESTTAKKPAFKPTLHQPVFATPKADLKVRKDDGTYLPAEGDTVIYNTYYAKRFADGDITVTDKLPKEAPARS